MKIVKTLLCILLTLVVLTSCDLLGDGEEYGTWLADATEWADDDGNNLSFVEVETGVYYIDLTYIFIDGETKISEMAFIDEDDYTVSGTTLTGLYSTNYEPDPVYDITIEFTYANGILTADIDVDETEGVLVDRVLQLQPAM